MSEFTVLGLLGPAGSGKDLVADWFVEKGFVKIAFADPMKRFVAKAFGISPARLWGPSELRNELFDVDEAWWYEAIGHFGKAANDEIINSVLTDGNRVQGYLKLHEWMTSIHSTFPTRISARFILQTLGTEWGRTIDELMWANYTHRIAAMLQANPCMYTQTIGLFGHARLQAQTVAGVVIPDHRFKNEVEATHKAGGYVMRLRRLALEKKEDSDIGVAGHRSEAEQRLIPDDLFDMVFNFPEGVSKVHELLEAAYAEKLWTKDKTQRMHLL